MRISKTLLLPVLVSILASPAAGVPESGRTSIQSIDGHEVSIASYSIPSSVAAADGSSEPPAIAFTVFRLAESLDTPAPLVLHGNGFGLGRAQELVTREIPNGASFWDHLRSLLTELVLSGYTVISVDYRGHGDSGGMSRAMDPFVEIADFRSVLDWAEAHLPLLADDSGDPLVGTVGGSFGGAYQLLLAALDPRVDAIVPAVTWNDLSRSLFANGVVKQGWLEFECMMATRGGVRADGLFDRVCARSARPGAAYVEELGDGAYAAQELLTAWSRNGLGHVAGAWQAARSGLVLDPRLESVDPRPIHALIVQATEDVLFPLNESLHNLDILSHAGGDVRLVVFRSGHVNPFAAQKNLPPRCAGAEPIDLVASFFAEKLRGTAPDPAARFCFQTSPATSRTLEALPSLGTARPFEASVGDGDTFLPLLTLDRSADLIGVPRLTLTVTASEGAPQSIALLGIATRQPGEPPRLLSDQVTAFRTGDYPDVELAGFADRLDSGAEVGLVLFESHAQFRRPGAGDPVAGVLPGNRYRVRGEIRLPEPLAVDEPAGP